MVALQPKCSLENMCSWIRVSWMLVSAESVTMRQLMTPSHMVCEMAWRRRLMTCIGVTSIGYGLGSGG